MPRRNAHDTINTGKPAGVKKPKENWDFFFHLLIKYGGNLTRACELAEINRETVYYQRNTHPEFEERFQKAKQMGIDAMEDEATRRAMEGVKEGVYYLGEKIDFRTIYSDGLLQFMLKAARPEKYKDRVSTENVNLNVDAQIEDKEVLDSLASKLKAILPPEAEQR